MKDTFDGLISSLDTAEERSLSQRIWQQDSQKPKSKENKDEKKAEQNIQVSWGNYKRYIHVTGIQEGEEMNKRNN